jgi:DNA primase
LDIGIQEQPFEAIARKLVAQDTLQPIGRIIEIEDVPLADVRVTLVKLHLDVINEELKRLRTLAPSDPERIAQERELILRQFAVRKASLS